MLTEQDVRRQVAVLLDQYGLPAMSPQATLEQLGADSLDLAELLVQIEEMYEISFPRDDMVIRPESTVNDVVGEIMGLLGTAPTPE